MTNETWSILNRPSIKEFFTIPLGIIFSVEARTTVKGNNQIENSFVQIITKDNRQYSFILKDFRECDRIRDQINII